MDINFSVFFFLSISFGWDGNCTYECSLQLLDNKEKKSIAHVSSFINILKVNVSAKIEM